MTVKLYVDWSWMAYSPTGSSDLFSILSCMTSNFLYLSFSTLYSSSLWRTDTIAFTKLNNPPHHHHHWGLNRGCTVSKWSVKTWPSCAICTLLNWSWWLFFTSRKKKETIVKVTENPTNIKKTQTDIREVKWVFLEWVVTKFWNFYKVLSLFGV